MTTVSQPYATLGEAFDSPAFHRYLEYQQKFEKKPRRLYESLGRDPEAQAAAAFVRERASEILNTSAINLLVPETPRPPTPTERATEVINALLRMTYQDGAEEAIKALPALVSSVQHVNINDYPLNQQPAIAMVERTMYRALADIVGVYQYSRAPLDSLRERAGELAKELGELLGQPYFTGDYNPPAPLLSTSTGIEHLAQRDLEEVFPDEGVEALC